MGVHIFCNIYNYYSSCSKWNTIKYDLFFYCLQYIKKNNIATIDDDIVFTSNSRYMLNKWCNDLINKYYTIFEKAKMTGIVALFNKKDCDDYYSIEDAFSILNMLLTIYDVLSSSDKIIVDTLILIFTVSVQKSTIVTIE